jgi:hypothetical protein
MYCCFTAALLLLYCFFTAALLLLYCCFTAALLLLQRHLTTYDDVQAGGLLYEALSY